MENIPTIGTDKALNLNKQDKVETAFGSKDIDKVRNSSRLKRVKGIIAGLRTAITTEKGTDLPPEK